MKKLKIIIGVALAVLIFAPLIGPIFMPWSEINCEHQEVNIQTGQARYTHLLWFVTVSQRIEETPLSDALQGETVEAAEIEPWHRVNTLSFAMGHSPHYRYHGAFSQMHVLDGEWEPEQKRDVAKAILTSWQESGDYFAADHVIDELWQQHRLNK